MQLTYQELSQSLKYDRDTGNLFNRKTGKEITSSPNIQVRIRGLKHMLSRAKVSYILANGVIPETPVFLKKDGDYTASNLSLTREPSLSKECTISYNPNTDKTLIRWKEDGVYRQRSFIDVTYVTKFISDMGFTSKRYRSHPRVSTKVTDTDKECQQELERFVKSNKISRKAEIVTDTTVDHLRMIREKSCEQEEVNYGRIWEDEKDLQLAEIESLAHRIVNKDALFHKATLRSKIEQLEEERMLNNYYNPYMEY